MKRAKPDDPMLERADELAVSSRRTNLTCVGLKNNIYAALWEARQEGYERGVREASAVVMRHNCCVNNPLCDKCYASLRNRVGILSLLKREGKKRGKS